MAIHLGRRLPDASCGQPGRRTEGGPVLPDYVPIRPCSRRGLPCRFRLRTRGGLLPHRFTLARFAGGLFSVALSLRFRLLRTVPRRALPGAVPSRSPDFPHAVGARPSGRLTPQYSRPGSPPLSGPQPQARRGGAKTDAPGHSSAIRSPWRTACEESGWPTSPGRNRRWKARKHACAAGVRKPPSPVS